jgi:hypothetical protein
MLMLSVLQAEKQNLKNYFIAAILLFVSTSALAADPTASQALRKFVQLDDRDMTDIVVNNVDNPIYRGLLSITGYDGKYSECSDANVDFKEVFFKHDSDDLNCYVEVSKLPVAGGTFVRVAVDECGDESSFRFLGFMFYPNGQAPRLANSSDIELKRQKIRQCK